VNWGWIRLRKTLRKKWQKVLPNKVAQLRSDGIKSERLELQERGRRCRSALHDSARWHRKEKKNTKKIRGRWDEEEEDELASPARAHQPINAFVQRTKNQNDQIAANQKRRGAALAPVRDQFANERKNTQVELSFTKKGDDGPSETCILHWAQR